MAVKSNYCFSCPEATLEVVQHIPQSKRPKLTQGYIHRWSSPISRFWYSLHRIFKTDNTATMFQNGVGCFSQLKTVTLIAMRYMLPKCYDKGDYNLGKVREELFLSLLLWHCNLSMFVEMYVGVIIPSWNTCSVCDLWFKLFASRMQAFEQARCFSSWCTYRHSICLGSPEH